MAHLKTRWGNKNILHGGIGEKIFAIFSLLKMRVMHGHDIYVYDLTIKAIKRVALFCEGSFKILFLARY
jgi:hypothetical protein